MGRLLRFVKRLGWLFVLMVVAPTLLALLYFGLVASDVYIAESRFVVRNPQRAAQPGLGALLQGSGFTRSQDDTYSVHDYVLSRDALVELDQTLKVRDAFSSGSVDFINRFPGLSLDRSFEAFYRYYQKQISLNYDSASSITTLQVRAFTAEQARDINDLLLLMGERLLNNLNIRSRQDLIQVAAQEVQVAEAKAKSAALAMSMFRANRDVFDPNAQSALQLQGVAKLQESLLATEAQLAQLRLVAPTNSQIGPLASQAEGLRRSIAAETAKVLGPATSLTSKAPAYDRLALDKTFADRQLGAALAALEEARSEAARKQLYLERLVQPNLPDSAVEPRRVRSIFMVFVLGLICWGVVSLVVASVREHRD